MSSNKRSGGIGRVIGSEVGAVGDELGKAGELGGGSGREGRSKAGGIREDIPELKAVVSSGGKELGKGGITDAPSRVVDGAP